MVATAVLTRTWKWTFWNGLRRLISKGPPPPHRKEYRPNLESLSKCRLILLTVWVETIEACAKDDCCFYTSTCTHFCQKLSTFWIGIPCTCSLSAWFSVFAQTLTSLKGFNEPRPRLGYSTQEKSNMFELILEITLFFEWNNFVENPATSIPGADVALCY